MIRITLEEIENVLTLLSVATAYAKQARHVARKVYGKDEEISLNLKYAYADIQKAARILEGRS